MADDSGQPDPVPSGGDELALAPEAGARRFNLDSLEPRILLSGASVLAELARMVEPGEQLDASEPPEVIVEEIDASLKSEIGLAGLSDPRATDAENVSVVWPAGWTRGGDDSKVATTVLEDTDATTQDTRGEIVPQALRSIEFAVTTGDEIMPRMEALASTDSAADSSDGFAAVSAQILGAETEASSETMTW